MIRTEKQGLAPGIGVLGAGSWGTCLAILLAGKNLPVTLWVRRKELQEKMEKSRENSDYLPGIPLPECIRVTSCLEDAVRDKEVIFLSVPSHALREIVIAFRGLIAQETIIVNTAKGLAEDTLERLSQVIGASLLPGTGWKVAVLSGPNHAEEVSRFLPAAAVVASTWQKTAERVQDVLMTPSFRVYTNLDVTGVELGGALKNVIAISAGVCDGLQLGDNTKAALLTRGLVEITRLGVAMGARPRTFSGLTGLGDLFVTCTSAHSRNRYVGLMLGRGKSLHEITSSMKMVAEGIKTTKAAYRLALRHKIEMPITREAYNILFKGKPPLQAVESLMGREKTHEIEEFAFQ